MEVAEKRKYDHLMVDIETMGTGFNSAIVSIAAVEFDIDTGLTGRTFQIKVSLKSCLDVGMKVDADTILWWMQQSEEARAGFGGCTTVSIRRALLDFSSFCHSDYKVWGNSARFDLGILENAYKRVGMPVPWKYYNERCVRTLASICPELKDKTEFIGTKHNPVDDCYYQIEYCARIWGAVKSELKHNYL